MSAFLSGEMRDTVEMNPAGAYGQCQADLVSDAVSDAQSSPRTILFSQ